MFFIILNLIAPNLDGAISKLILYILIACENYSYLKNIFPILTLTKNEVSLDFAFNNFLYSEIAS